MEPLRRALRKIFSPQSGIYKTGATMLDFISTIKSDGYKTWRILQELQNANKNDPACSVTLQNLKFPILIRPGTQDAHTIINNIIRKEYDQTTITGSPKWMIDAGAYIGDTSAYFLSRFHDIRVLALEPGTASYKMARQNLEPYGERAILLQKGLYITDGTALFSGDNTGASISNTGFEIDCTTIKSLLDLYSIPRVDILKMDIEGAEEVLFLEKPEEWLNRVDLLIIEIHGDHLFPLISRVLSDNGFSMKQYRSVWYCRSGRR
jgi:FkbM family methyltransferase